MFFGNKIKKAMDEFLEKEKNKQVVEKAMDEFLEKEKNEQVVEKSEETTPEPEPEEWVWVNGYKGTDKDMCCRGYQFELDKQFDMPEDAEIIECQSGFHLCMKLDHVFNYYDICNNNRFFRVRALVRKKDAEEYDFTGGNICNVSYYVDSGGNMRPKMRRTKLVAKSIVFEEELTADEILGNQYDIQGWSEEDKKMVLAVGVKKAYYIRQVRELADLGFSGAFASYIIDKHKYEVAKVVASQPDLSMDMKALLIFKD